MPAAHPACALLAPTPTVPAAAAMSSTNIFAALSDASKKKKSKSSKGKEGEDKPAAAPKVDRHAELEKAVFAGSAGGGLSNWADESEDEGEWGEHHPASPGDGWEEVRRGRHRCRAPALAPARPPPIAGALWGPASPQMRHGARRPRAASQPASRG